MGIGLAIQPDRELISSAINNLLQNAFKFTWPATAVTITAHIKADNLLINIQDHCGGLGDINKEDIFLPFKQLSCGKSGAGVGVGLSISKRAVEANGDILTVRELSGSGSVFTISLPLHQLAYSDQQ